MAGLGLEMFPQHYHAAVDGVVSVGKAKLQTREHSMQWNGKSEVTCLLVAMVSLHLQAGWLHGIVEVLNSPQL